MMKTLLAIALLMTFQAVASAAERSVPTETLSAMGIGQMQTLSDHAGLDVRGKGTFANVWGSSQARWGGQSSSNNYSAGSSWLGQGSSARGSSFSFGGNVGANFSGFGRFGR